MDVNDEQKQSLRLTQLPDELLSLIYKKLNNKLYQRYFRLTSHRFLDIAISNCTCLDVTCSTKLSKSYNIESIVLGIYLGGFSHFDSISILNLSFSTLTDNGLETITKYCNKSLIHVNFKGCHKITNTGIYYLKQNCPQLRGLKLTECCNLVGVTSEQGFSENLSYLEVDARLLSRPGLLSGGGLEYLLLSDYHFKNEHVLFQICSDLVKNLKILFLMGSDVTDDIITGISKGCPLLQELKLEYCFKIERHGWDSIGLHCQNLEIVHVNQAYGLCDGGLLGLGNCSKLCVLYMTDCPKITEVGVHDFEIKRPDVMIKEQMVHPCFPSWAL